MRALVAKKHPFTSLLFFFPFFLPSLATPQWKKKENTLIPTPYWHQTNIIITSWWRKIVA